MRVCSNGEHLRGAGWCHDCDEQGEWITVRPADSPRPEGRELREALRWIKERAGFQNRNLACSMIEDCADAALREGGES